jgi:uncharacterized protein
VITRFLAERWLYDGSQLRAHWILRHTGIAGDALVAWRGPCRVSAAEMADLEDLLRGPGIAGADMLHFLEERFDDGDLPRAILRQRLLAACALEVVRELGTSGASLSRTGDDLYVGAGKLSISVATRTPCSTMIHFAMNVTNEGTPVATASLADLGIEPRAFADALLVRMSAEDASQLLARAKVRAKGESE